MTIHYPAKPDHFEFDASVADVFDDMAARSLPGYHHVYRLISAWVQAHPIPAYAQVWDFGTSTGAGLQAVQRVAPHPYIHYMGCDISDPMLDKAAKRCAWADLFQHDLTQGLPPQLEPGNVAVAMFGWTLQFIEDLDVRRKLLRDAFKALIPGGVLFVMEKFKDSSDFSQIQQDTYISWRRDNGYTLSEIKAKTQALRGAMFPWEAADLMIAMSDLPTAETITLYRMFSFGGYAFVKGQ